MLCARAAVMTSDPRRGRGRGVKDLSADRGKVRRVTLTLTFDGVHVVEAQPAVRRGHGAWK